MKTCEEIVENTSYPGVTTSYCHCTATAYGQQTAFFLNIFSIVYIVAAILYLVFLIWMIVDCAMRDKKEDFSKLTWLLLMLIIPIFSIFYYFLVKRRLDKEKKIVKKS